MNKQIVVFSRHYPLPIKSGYDLRVLQQLASLSKDYDVTLIGINSQSRNQWPHENSVQLYNERAIALCIYEDSFLFVLDKLLSGIFAFATKEKGLSVSYFLYLLQLRLPMCVLKEFILRSWTTWICYRKNATIFIVNYSWYIKYKPWGKIKLVVEMHDIVELSQYLTKIVKSRLDKFCQSQLPWQPNLLTYESILLDIPEETNQKIKEEVARLSSSDLSIAICDRDARIVRSYDLAVNLVVARPLEINPSIADLLLKPEPVRKNPLIDKPYLLLPLGYNNLLNTYGYIDFMNYVLPCIDFPGDSCIVVTGNAAISDLHANSRLLHVGFVDNYYEYLQSSLGLIACTNIGTGFQMKLFEAVSCGKPVICFDEAVGEVMSSTKNIITVSSYSAFANEICILLKTMPHSCTDADARNNTDRSYISYNDILDMA